MAERSSGRSTDPVRRAPGSSPVRPRTVLVIGDSEFVVDALNFVVFERDIAIHFLQSARRDVLATAHAEHPDVVLIDLSLKGGGAVELSTEFRRENPQLRTLALGSDEEIATVQQIAATTFDAFVSKSVSLTDLAAAILGVERMLPPIQEAIGDAGPTLEEDYDEEAFARRAGAELTFREHEVLVLLVKGASSKEIARELAISKNTLRTHIQNTMTKLHVHTRLQAVMFAVRHGLVAVPKSPFTAEPDPPAPSIGKQRNG